ncbi:VOC family protein [Nesterenkonia sp. CL21]|uniref:VOC family protein n=1 Tax=Nesterenkonia sp. CL21 TaxID=3064894 RepID=UPI00287867DD|nr:VOC family protein [Nesterenkonia sp. CL21]MDS2171350.1 VOC family protein [Nesterenkonia sp. CL21]
MPNVSPDPAPAADGRALNPATAMDAVTLRVGDLEAMSAYYETALVMEPLQERTRGREVHRVLGRGATPMVRLIHTPDLPGVDPHEAGLFHTAFLFEDEASLAATVHRAAQHPQSRYVGSADHLVSEAFYFTDPEGNGIELYRDRPRETWEATGTQVRMDNLPLDPAAYLRRHLDQEVLDAGAARAGRVGHVHLQVGDVARAREFYVGTVGFDPTASWNSALFASAGGYHHHVAMNTWNSRGAGPRSSRLGLGDLAITVPGREDLDALVSRYRAQGLGFADEGHRVVTEDPWGTQVSVAVPGTETEELLSR